MDQALTIFRALADPTRLRILALLRAMELSVGEIAVVLGQSQPRVSRHVKILADAGLVERRREGSWVFLALGGAGRVGPVFAALDSWNDWGEIAADLARLDAVRADRAASADRYFEERAGNWDAIRSLHVAEAEVEAAISAVLADRPFGRLVDIGTGTGRMVELLGPDADSAVGIDRSPEMLRFARAKLARATELSHVELRQGDMYALPLADGCADAVLSVQVLEHVRDLDRYLGEAARVLRDDGTLILSTHGAWLYHPHPEDHRRWTRTGLVVDLEARGFAVHSVEPLVGPLATTTLIRLAGFAFVLRRLPLVGRPLAGMLAMVMNLRGWIEDRVTPASIRRDNACIYVVRCTRAPA
jgi:ArsR family transcriptional regulator